MADTSKYNAELAEHGFTKIEGALSAVEVRETLDLIKKIFASTPLPDQTSVPYLNRGHEVLYNLQNKDLFFVRSMFSQPLVREVLMWGLNDRWYKQIPKDRPNYILRSLIARNGGSEALPLHIDSFVPSGGTFSWSMQVAFVLEDQSPQNGCTVFVPGSHIADRYADPADLSKAVPVSSRAGDIVIWDSRTWHGTTGNKTGNSRWSFIATFVRWWVKQNYDLTRNLPQEIYEKLSDEEKSVMGYCSRPPVDEFDRIDIKSGYDDLLPKVSDYR